jgi:hypothetical protein
MACGTQLTLRVASLNGLDPVHGEMDPPGGDEWRTVSIVDGALSMDPRRLEVSDDAGSSSDPSATCDPGRSSASPGGAGVGCSHKVDVAGFRVVRRPEHDRGSVAGFQRSPV